MKNKKISQLSLAILFHLSRRNGSDSDFGIYKKIKIPMSSLFKEFDNLMRYGYINVSDYIITLTDEGFNHLRSHISHQKTSIEKVPPTFRSSRQALPHEPYIPAISYLHIDLKKKISGGIMPFELQQPDRS